MTAHGDLNIGIEHVGSAAVDRIFSKPGVDFDVVICDYFAFDAAVASLLLLTAYIGASLLFNMKNQYLKNLNKIEFVITNACTGRCKHCSQGEHPACGDHIDPQLAALMVRKIAAQYDIQTVMTFGGEPLLYPDAVYTIMTAAKELHISKRQLITNGYFSKSAERIRQTVRQLAVCGVNDILLSVDAFHQETIDLTSVVIFAGEAKKCGIPIRFSPAWLVSRTDENPYNQKTRALLDSLAYMDIPTGEGNVIFPEGNACKFLAAYFTDVIPENPYAEDARDVRCISFSPNGDVLGGNAYQRDIMEIIGAYAP